MKKLIVILTSVFLLVFMSACGNGNSGSKPAENSNSPAPAASESSKASAQPAAAAPIKIGGLFAASGGASSLGKPEMDTVKMMVEQANANGGIGGRQLELVAYDTKGDQNEAVLDMKKLIENDKVAAVIGGTTSGECMALIPIAEKAKVPFIALGASKAINIPAKPYVFKTPQGDDIVAPRVVKYLKDHNLTKVAWLNVDNSFGSSGKEEYDKAAKAAGIETVISESFEATVNDAKPMLTRVKNANPQAIVVWGTTQESAVVTKNIRELKIDVPILESHGIANAQFIELAGKAAEGVIFPAGRLLVADKLPDDNKQKKILVDYAKNFQAKFNYPASTFGGHAWDAFEILTNAIKTAGDDPQKIRDTLENNTKDIVGTGGIFNYTKDDHNGLNADALAMIKIEMGKWVLEE
ncbi:ABC transporter substrate-binding protein [Ferviditalea candida]|uniref:ABC transporter substrate-binding protein n=1 Tax=Ferviditalea candida TaxID=3108399 RepID=A0ABU5ZGT2_9BACL|nr:ABC transporter substrate-binding protein [Paenibacillaceae bacterium T2]